MTVFRNDVDDDFEEMERRPVPGGGAITWAFVGWAVAAVAAGAAAAWWFVR